MRSGSMHQSRDLFELVRLRRAYHDLLFFSQNNVGCGRKQNL